MDSNTKLIELEDHCRGKEKPRYYSISEKG